MEATIYELVQKRKELIQALDDLRSERAEDATVDVRIEDQDDVDTISLQEYRKRAENLIGKIGRITVALREANVAEQIDEIEMTPEEARIRRDALDREIQSLRGLKDVEEDAFPRGKSDVVEVSRVKRAELDQYVEDLSEERGKLDAALQRFNLDTALEVEI